MIIIDPNFKSGNSALDKTCAHIADAFRPERKEHEAVLSKGHHVKEMAQAGRYSFPEACRKMQLEPGTVQQSFDWLRADNIRINATYESEVHKMTTRDWFMLGFINHEEACLESNVVSFNQRGAA